MGPSRILLVLIIGINAEKTLGTRKLRMTDEVPNKKGLSSGRLPKLPSAVANLNGLGVPLTATKWGTLRSPPTVILGAIRATVDANLGLSSVSVSLVSKTGASSDVAFLSVRESDEHVLYVGSRTDAIIGDFMLLPEQDHTATWYLYPLATDTNFSYKIVVVGPASSNSDLPLFLSVAAIGAFSNTVPDRTG